MKLSRHLVIIGISINLSACAFSSVFVSYPSHIAPIKNQLNQASNTDVAKQLAAGINTDDGLLYAQEAGRVAQIEGHFKASQDYYQQAIRDYQHFDDKAKVSLSDLGATGSSLLINDNVIPYRGPGYERIMLHQYQALNFVFEHNHEAALVEIRRANELQQTEQQRYQKSLKAVNDINNGTIDAEVDRLSAAAGKTTSSYLNAYSYYTTALLYELLGQANDAFIDYRKAAQIAPDNRYIQQDLVRLAKQLDMPQYSDFKRRWGTAKSATSTQGTVVFIVEKGFVPTKQSITVPFTINSNWQTASIASYLPNYQMVSPTTITGLGQPLITAPIANIGALAITALKEDLPAALARQAARVYAKSRLNQSFERDDNSQSNAASVASLAIQIFNVVTEQADLRSWLTLPKQAQIARQYVKGGQYTISLNHSTQSIQVKAGHTTLVWAIDTGNYTYFHSIII